MVTMRSPDEMLEAAKKEMLEGREPTTREDWAKVVNFWAFNIQKGLGLEENVCLLLWKLYNVPLTEQEIRTIARSQAR